MTSKVHLAIFFLVLIGSQDVLAAVHKLHTVESLKTLSQRRVAKSGGTLGGSSVGPKSKRCGNGEVKTYNLKPECRIGTGKDGEERDFTFKFYLEKLKCPTFNTAVLKKAATCFADQNPCKQLNLETLTTAFERCSKQKLPQGDADGQNAFEKPDRTAGKPMTVFHETFEGKVIGGYGGRRRYAMGSENGPVEFEGHTWDKELSTLSEVLQSTMLGSVGKGHNAALFAGNKDGVRTLKHGGARYLTTKEIDASKGGLISFYLKDGPDKGDKICQINHEGLVRLEKRQAQRRIRELEAYQKCQDKPGCSGHGTGVYQSSCFKDGRWVEGARSDKDKYLCHNEKAMACICKCEADYMGKNCGIVSKVNTKDGFSRCRNVGLLPHPSTANGESFNLYDVGEFVWSRHPDVNVEAHVVTKAAGSRAKNAGVSLRVCNGGPFQDGVTNKGGNMKGPCDTVSMMDCKFFYQDGEKCIEQKTRDFTTKLGIKVTTSTISVNGWSIEYDCGEGLNSYLTVKSPRDGKSTGLCGYYGNKGTSGDTSGEKLLASSGKRGDFHMTSKEFFSGPMTIKTKENSHFSCSGFEPPVYNQNFKFKRIFSRIVSRRLPKAAPAKAMQPKSDVISTEEATELCKAKLVECTGMPAPDSKAMETCVQDFVKVGRMLGKHVLESACEVAKKEEANIFADVKANEHDEKHMVADGAALRMPGKTDPVVQWCVEDCKYPETKECLAAKEDMRSNPLSKHTMESVNKLCIWKQLKAFPAKLYAETNMTTDWSLMTLRIPQEAVDRQLHPSNPANKGQKLRIRFYQEEHDCYCCNVFGIDDIKVVTGGWPVRILADDSFELFADGKLVGTGKYNEMKEISRFRVDPASKSFAVKVNGRGNNRAGFIASIGDSIVSSSTWKCKDLLFDENAAALAKADHDDTNWAKAAEIGTNEGEGTVPWGVVPGMASKAFWIYSHSSYAKIKTSAMCRIDTTDAWHSYSKEHLGASRWSCKSARNRQSPFVTPLDSEKLTVAMAVSGATKSSLEKVQEIGQSLMSYDDSPNSAYILMKIALGELISKAEEGAMIKSSKLRLFVTSQSGTSFKYCKNIKPWDSDITFNTFSEQVMPGMTDCKTAKASRIYNFVALDVTDWVRDWISNRKSNYGFTIIHDGVKSDAVSFSSPSVSGELALQRPRLSLSCHGDNAASDLTFKAKYASLQKAARASVQEVRNAGT
jgi:hypothetical protein